MEGYCVRCRAQREIKNGKVITMKNGKLANKGGVSYLWGQHVPYRCKQITDILHGVIK